MHRFPRLRRWLEQLLHTHDTPHRTAGAFALGVFFGFSPFLGLHTLLGLAFAFALRLNRVAVLLGVYSNLPWILPPYYSMATLGGAALLGVEVPPGVIGQLTGAVADRSWGDFRQHAQTLAPLAWAYVTGSTLGALLLALVAYRVSLTMILAHRRHVALHHRPPRAE
jgi:uncharacterized protein (DUF2062 family)